MSRSQVSGHFTGAELDAVASGRKRPDLGEQARMAAELTSCPACWARLTGLEPREPETAEEALARALSRVTQRGWGLALPGIHLRLTNPAEPGLYFAFLVLTEAIDLAISDPAGKWRYLELARELTSTLPPSPTVRDLQAHVECASAGFAVADGNLPLARSWLVFAEQSLAEGSGAMTVKLAIVLAKFRLSTVDHEYWGHNKASSALVVGDGNPARRLGEPSSNTTGPSTFFALTLLMAAAIQPGDVVHHVLFALTSRALDVPFSFEMTATAEHELLKEMCYRPERLELVKHLRLVTMILVLFDGAGEGGWAAERPGLVPSALADLEAMIADLPGPSTGELSLKTIVSAIIRQVKP